MRRGYKYFYKRAAAWKSGDTRKDPNAFETRKIQTRKKKSKRNQNMKYSRRFSFREFSIRPSVIDGGR